MIASRFCSADVVNLAAAESTYCMRWLVAPLVGPDRFLLDTPVALLDFNVLIVADGGLLTADYGFFELSVSA